MAHQLNETRIYSELKRRTAGFNPASKYLGQIDSSIDGISIYLNEVRRYFYHFTDHCIAHSVRIIYAVGSILTDDQLNRLSAVELYLFISAALVHDIGMVVSEVEIRALVEDNEFKEERIAILRANSMSPADDWLFRGVERLVVSEYVRRRHGRRCLYALDGNIPPLRQLTNDESDLKKWIGRISVGHTLTSQEILNQDEYPTKVRVGNEDANIQFLTFCLRIGDLLDINTARANPVLREISEPLQMLSQAHWDQYRDVELRNLGPNDTITIAGTCPSQESERVLREWVTWLKDECELAVLTLNSCAPQYNLHIGRIECKVQAALDCQGIPLYEFHNFKFNLDQEQVFKRLFGGRLYGRPDAALRELIQNGVDATRMRVALELSRQPSWKSLTSVERQSQVRDAIRAQAGNLEITVRLERKISAQSGRDELWLHVTDRGVGMSREVIERYLLRVGRSRWREDPCVRGLDCGTVGEFGIGFLSTFMVSERTIIETQSSLPNEVGIRATIYSWKGYLATQRVDLDRAGTTVSLLLRSDAQATFADLLKIVKFWCPFFELPICVIDQNGCETKIPVLVENTRIADRRMVLFSLDDGPSRTSINEAYEIKRADVDPPLSQDGLAIPDVPPPIREIPAHNVLRRYGVKVDLRGPDRISLDLSRNLIEGGADAFWETMVSRIWQSTVRNGLKFKAVKDALWTYVQQDFEQERSQIAFRIGPGAELRTGSPQDIISVPTLEFADSGETRLKVMVDECDDILLLPNVPDMQFLGFRDEDSETGSDDVTEYWKRRGLYLDWGWETNPLPVSLRTISSYMDVINKRYVYAIKGKSGFTKVSKENAVGSSLPLSTLDFWRMSANWFAIREPKGGLWKALHRNDLDALKIAGVPKLGLEQFLIVLLYEFWPIANEWDVGWPLPSGASLGTLVGDAIIKSKFDPHGDDDDDEEDSEDEQDCEDEEQEYDEDDPGEEESHSGIEEEPLDPLEQQRELRHGKQADKVISDFISNVLPAIPLEEITSCLTPWDRSAWTGEL